MTSFSYGEKRKEIKVVLADINWAILYWYSSNIMPPLQPSMTAWRRFSLFLCLKIGVGKRLTISNLGRWNQVWFDEFSIVEPICEFSNGISLKDSLIQIYRWISNQVCCSSIKYTLDKVLGSVSYTTLCPGYGASLLKL